MTDLEKIEKRLAELLTETEELNTAKRVLLRLSGKPETNGSPTGESGKSLKGKKMRECAEEILREHGGSLHFKKLADEALGRGYTTGKDTSTTKSIRQSFWATMKRLPDVFEPTGRGEFKLK